VPRLAVAHNVCQRTDFFVQVRLVSPNLLSTTQSAVLDAGKPIPLKIYASREPWKSDSAVPCQLFRRFPKNLTRLFEQNLSRLWQKIAQSTQKNYLDGKSALTPGSGCQYAPVNGSPAICVKEKPLNRNLGIMEAFP
jgi:hypothetical protein